MKRSIVFQLINEERDYQDSLGPNRTNGSRHTVGEELVLMDTYLRKAFDAWSDHPGDEHALDEIRKVAALAVRCMEHYGAPARSKM